MPRNRSQPTGEAPMTREQFDPLFDRGATGSPLNPLALF